jgi:hypothetical protein
MIKDTVKPNTISSWKMINMFHTQQQHVDNDAFMMNSSNSMEDQCDHGEKLRSTKTKLTWKKIVTTMTYNSWA